MNRPPKGRRAAPVQVIINNEEAVIRRLVPAAIIASLQADAARALVARPDIAVTVVNRQVGRGRTTLVVLYSGYANPADNGLSLITFMGAEQAVAERVRRTLLELLAGPERRGEGREGGS